MSQSKYTQVTIRLAGKGYDTTVDVTDDEFRELMNTGEFFGDEVSRVMLAQFWDFDAWHNFTGPARGLITLIER